VSPIVTFTDPKPHGVSIVTNKGYFDGMLSGNHRIAREKEHIGGGHYVECLRPLKVQEVRKFALQTDSRLTIDGNKVTEFVSGIYGDMQGAINNTAVGGHESETGSHNSEDTPPPPPRETVRTSAQVHAQALLDSPTPKLTRQI
jgi:hypothetical protein